MAARNDNGITTNTSTQLTTPPPHPPSKHFPPSIHIHTPPPHSTSPHTHMPPAATHINAHPFHIPRHTHTHAHSTTHTPLTTTHTQVLKPHKASGRTAMCAMFDDVQPSRNRFRRNSSDPEQLLTTESQPLRLRSATEAHVRQQGISKKHVANLLQVRGGGAYVAARNDNDWFNLRHKQHKHINFRSRT